MFLKRTGIAISGCKIKPIPFKHHFRFHCTRVNISFVTFLLNFSKLFLIQISSHGKNKSSTVPMFICLKDYNDTSNIIKVHCWCEL